MTNAHKSTKRQIFFGKSHEYSYWRTKKNASGEAFPNLQQRATGSEVQRPFVAGQRGFVHRFGQCRMGVANAGDVFAGSTEFHRSNGFGDELRGVGADDVHAKDAVGPDFCQLVRKF